MRITEQQEAFLKDLVCQRLRDDENNKEYIKGFACARNKGLSAELREYAWDKDETGEVSYYLIKNRNNKVLLYFSLQCGSVFEKIDEDEIRRNLQHYWNLLQRVNNAKSSASLGKNMAQLMQLERTFRMPVDELQRLLNDIISNKKDLLGGKNADRKFDKNPLLARVFRTHPAVELVHFVANDNAKSIWRESGIQHRMGEVLFWYYVCPIMMNIYKVLGCKYAYLYAADDSVDMSLINRYHVRFNFQCDNKLGAAKPSYDFRCNFMCQHLDDMRDFCEEYWENFNPDPDDILI